MLPWIDPDLWTALTTTFHSGQLVIYAGAGISAAAKLPLWPALARTLVDHVRRAGHTAAADEAQQLSDRGRLVEAISATQLALGPVPFSDTIARLLDDRGKPVPDLALAIAALRDKLQGVVTTNLDRFLERASGGEWVETVKPVGDLAQQRGFLWKAHGTLQDRATWVFARAAYDHVMFGDPQYQATFEALYRARTFLFVGCSLSDDDLDLTLGKARALSAGQPPTHYAVLEGPIGTYRQRTLEAAGLRIFAYPQGQHDQVTAFLRALGGTALAAAPNPPNQLAPPRIPSPTQPISSAASPGTTGTHAPNNPAPSPPNTASPKTSKPAHAWLPESVLHELRDAAVTVGLDRHALLASLDQRLVSGFREAPSVSAQLWEDLAALNKIESLPDGSVPLRSWLLTAAHLVEPRRETATFRRALDLLKSA